MEPVLGGLPKRPVMPETPMKAGTATPRVPGGLKHVGWVGWLQKVTRATRSETAARGKSFVVDHERGARCRPRWLGRLFELGARSKGRCALQTTAFVINDKLTLPDPTSEGVNVFFWNPRTEENAYVFPPFNIVGRVLAWAQQHLKVFTIVVPCWETQPWCPPHQ